MKSLFTHDFVFHSAIEPLTPLELPALQTNLYLSLVRAIVYQQLSGKVANVIFNRFLNLFDEQYPTQELLHLMPVEQLRTVGLSNAKANYVKNIAHFSLHNNLSFDYINELSNEDIVLYLTQIKGVGKWTVQMLLIFDLARPDVFPLNDLGVRNAIVKMYGITETGKQLDQQILRIAENWQPHRSMATRYLWHWLDTK